MPQQFVVTDGQRQYPVDLATQAELDAVATSAVATTNSKTDNYTLVLTDANKAVEINSATTSVVTVPPNSSVAFPVGTKLIVRQYGTGPVVVVGGVGVTVRARASAIKTAGQYAEATLTNRATDEWVLSGDTTTVAPASLFLLSEPWVAAHRGFGQYMGPDDSLAAMAETVNNYPLGSVLLDGGDTRRTSGGEVVIMHDSNVDRTTDGTGPVSSKTLVQFQALNIDPENSTPAVPGWAHETPPTLDQVLTAYGGEIQIQLEVKETLTTTSVQANVDAVVAKGLTESVMIGGSPTTTGQLDALDRVTDAGIAKEIILQDTTTFTAAQIIAKNPEYVAYEMALTPVPPAGGPFDGPTGTAYLQTLADAGIKNVAWMINRRTDWDIEKVRPGVVGCFSDWPHYTFRLNTPSNTDNFALGKYDHGQIPSQGSAAARMVFTGSPSRLQAQNSTPALAQFMLLGAISRDTPFTSIAFTFTYDVLDSKTTGWPMMAVWAPDDRDFYTGEVNVTANLGQAITVIIRQNGSMEMFRQDTQGVTAVSIATPLSTTAPTAGVAIPCLVERLAGSDKIKFTRTDTGQSITSTVAQWTTGGWTRGGYCHFGKSSLTNGAGRYSLSGITVTP